MHDVLRNSLDQKEPSITVNFSLSLICVIKYIQVQPRMPVDNFVMPLPRVDIAEPLELNSQLLECLELRCLYGSINRLQHKD